MLVLQERLYTRKLTKMMALNLPQDELMLPSKSICLMSNAVVDFLRENRNDTSVTMNYSILLFFFIQDTHRQIERNE